MRFSSLAFAAPEYNDWAWAIQARFPTEHPYRTNWPIILMSKHSESVRQVRQRWPPESANTHLAKMNLSSVHVIMECAQILNTGTIESAPAWF